MLTAQNWMISVYDRYTVYDGNMDLWIIAAPLGIQILLGIPRVSEPPNQKAPPFHH